jgi:hypothetical protein
VLARTDKLSLTGGGAVAVVAGKAELKASAATAVLARDEAELEQAAAGVLVARSARVSDSVVGVVIAQRVEGTNIRVLFGWREALAFGAAAGTALWLLTGFSRRGRG